MADKIFIDTNILVYANNTLSPFCQIARTKLQSAFTDYDTVWMSRQILREFAAVISREMVAVGDHDFSKQSFINLKLTIAWWKIQQQLPIVGYR